MSGFLWRFIRPRIEEIAQDIDGFCYLSLCLPSTLLLFSSAFTDTEESSATWIVVPISGASSRLRERQFFHFPCSNQRSRSSSMFDLRLVHPQLPCWTPATRDCRWFREDNRTFYVSVIASSFFYFSTDIILCQSKRHHYPEQFQVRRRFAKIFFFLSIVFPFSLHRIAFSIFLLVYPIALAKKNVPSSSDDPFKSRKGNEQNIERGRRRVRRIDNRDCHPRRFTLCRRQYGGRIKKEKENLSSPRSEVLFTLDRVSLAGTNIRSRETMFHGSSSNWLWRTEWIHFAVDSNFSSDSSNTDFFSIRYLPLAICFIAVK